MSTARYAQWQADQWIMAQSLPTSSVTLGNALVPRGCRVYGSDVKIHTGNGIDTLPDVSVICGEHQFYLGKKDIVLNPLLIVEVLSPSTEGYDRGEKFDHYQTIELLQDYVLVEQDEARIMLYSRREDYWELRQVIGRNSEIYLPSVAVTLALADVYALIDFGTETK